jgi:hypothetical protein
MPTCSAYFTFQCNDHNKMTFSLYWLESLLFDHNKMLFSLYWLKSFIYSRFSQKFSSLQTKANWTCLRFCVFRTRQVTTRMMITTMMVRPDTPMETRTGRLVHILSPLGDAEPVINIIATLDYSCKTISTARVMYGCMKHNISTSCSFY